jgi:hypothetical protein
VNAEADSRREAAGEGAAPDRRASQPSPDAVRCMHCGDVIGVYEPLIVYQGSEPVLTSLAAHPALNDTGAHYHHSCFTALDQTV